MWGEVGLDYHYDLSPRDVQRAVFTGQLEPAVRLGKPLTREAEAQRIPKARCIPCMPCHCRPGLDLDVEPLV